MEITSLQYSIDAVYKFHMHVRQLCFIGSFLVDKIEWLIRFMEGEAAGKDIIGGIQLGLLYGPYFW